MDESEENRQAARLLLRSAIRGALFGLPIVLTRAVEMDTLAEKLLEVIESRHLKAALAELAKYE